MISEYQERKLNHLKASQLCNKLITLIITDLQKLQLQLNDKHPINYHDKHIEGEEYMYLPNPEFEDKLNNIQEYIGHVLDFENNNHLKVIYDEVVECEKIFSKN